MRLTVVQVTQPSRFIFLKSALDAISQLLARCDWVDLVVVINGYSIQNESMALTLQSKFPNRVKILTSVQNLSMGHQILDLLKAVQLDWVQFPGDDDVVVPEAYERLLELISDKTLSAVAFSAKCMDIHGNFTGKNLQPSFLEGSSAERLLGALAVPPFVFPSLVFRLPAIGTSVFSSTLVFDWWLSLTLIRNGKIKLENACLVNYRIHSSQVSNSVKESRKRFEAGLMLRTFFLEHPGWIINQLYEEAHNLPKLLSRIPPIYGDPLLGARVVFDLRALLGSKFMLTDSTIGDLSSEMALSDGILMDEYEFPYFRQIASDELVHRLNFGFLILSGTCPELRHRLESIRNPNLIRSCNFGCQHSNQSSLEDVVVLDCAAFIDSNQASTWIDSVIRAAYSTNIKFRPKLSELSANESKLLRSFRSLAQVVHAWRRLLQKLHFTSGRSS